MGTIFIQMCLLFLLLQVISVCGKGDDPDHSSGRSRSKRQLPTVSDIYTLDHFIELVEKIERHPQSKGKSLKEIANYVRKLGYDSEMWRFLVGSADGLPYGILTSVEKRVLTNMVAHRYIGSRELGVVKTPTGNVAMGHVMTGICAGANRFRSLALPKIVGLSIDNLYAATISGDLGQTALHQQIDQSRPLFGPGGSWSPNEKCPATFNAPSLLTSEATNAELLGDIDGFLLGYNLPDYLSKQVRLGQLLRMYYSGGVLYDTLFASCNRKPKFLQLVNKDTLTRQVQDFMKGFKQVWYGSEDFSSVPSSLIPKLAANTTTTFHSYLDSISSSTTCAPQSKEGCELPANILFVMDESGSIGWDDYQKEKNFTIKVLDDFTISPVQTRVAVIEYSSSASLMIGLDAYGSKTRLKCAVEGIHYGDGGTDTGEAVRLAYRVMKAEEEKSHDVQQIMILLTDGQSNDPDDLRQAVKEAKANLKGVTMIAVGVGAGYKREELEMIATDPKSHVFTSTDFTQLADLVRTLRRKTCETPARLTISFRSDDGENKTVVSGFVSPGRSRYYALPAELFYGNRDITVKVTPYFGTVYVYASRTHKNPGPGNYTFKLVPKGGASLNLHVKDICRGYNETTCPPLYIAIQGSISKLSCSESHCTLPNQIKFQIAKGIPSKAGWIHGTPYVVILLVILHFALYMSY